MRSPARQPDETGVMDIQGHHGMVESEITGNAWRGDRMGKLIVINQLTLDGDIQGLGRPDEGHKRWVRNTVAGPSQRRGHGRRNGSANGP